MADEQHAAAGAQAAPPQPNPAAVLPRDLAKLAGLGALIGVPTGLVAFGFITLVHWLEDWLWTDLPDALGADAPPWYLVLGLPVLGAVLVYFARMLPGNGGHSPIEGASTSEVAKPAHLPGIILAALATLPFGLVLGPEAPLIALGSGLAVWLTGWAKLPPKAGLVVGMSGSGAAMSTLFGGPLVSGLMLLEGGVGAGALVIPLIIPALASSAVAYFLITGLGDWSGLPMAGMSLPGLPAYDEVLVRDIGVAVLVGLLAALVAHVVRTLATKVAAAEPRIGRLPLLLLGGAGVGALALVADLMGGDSQVVLFSGQTGVAPLVAESSAGVVLVLLVAKALGYVLSLGAGFRGGPIFPAIFLGVALAAFGVIAFDMSPTVAIAMGAAAGMTAMTRMVVSPVLFAALLTGRAGLSAISVAVIATVVAWLGSAVIDHRLLLRHRRNDADDAAVHTAAAGTALPAVRPGTTDGRTTAHSGESA